MCERRAKENAADCWCVWLVICKVKASKAKQSLLAAGLPLLRIQNQQQWLLTCKMQSVGEAVLGGSGRLSMTSRRLP